MPDQFSPVRDNNPMAFGVRLTAWTVGNTDLPPSVKAVCFNAAGTCTITNDDDSTEAGVPVQAMIPLLTIPKRVTAMGTATKCYLVR